MRHASSTCTMLSLIVVYCLFFFFFFFNDTATTEIYTLSLHDALPISSARLRSCPRSGPVRTSRPSGVMRTSFTPSRSEEHTSELQSPCNLVCRLLLEKKKKTLYYTLPRHTSRLVDRSPPRVCTSAYAC